ncbi:MULTISPECIES: hypothetical protein [unclassified Crossiella]|uniref:hypothetical protein n=1 Tax=unclassified Crossiella TaxID=2620835 RepID=UPI001FFEFE6A|nr:MULTISPECIES: hypothetical protein [unclassified Crossiella]MCK2242142.1 hypothetical protein [Crossiella sp. S99.2]MCK2256045.1 hypothetical protein [Crossiella sp. S99.1]
MADLTYTILGIDRGSPAFDNVAKAVDRAAQRLENLGSVSIKALGGVAAAGTASSVLIGGAMAGSSVAFLGMAVAAQASNERVRSSFAELGGGVRTEITAMTSHIAPELEAVAGKLTTTFGQLKPLLQTAFNAAGPQLQTLTDGVSAFALNAMPGMVRSVQRAGPVFEGLRDLLADVGSGVSGFLDELSKGSTGAGTVLSGLGGLLRSILPAAGALIRQLSDGAAGSFGAISGAVLGAVQVFGQLSGGALPVLTVALTAAAHVLEGVSSILSPLAGVLGSVTGAILAGALAWKVFSAASAGITTVIGGIDRVRTKMAEATTGASGFFARMRGLGGLLGGPLGLAIGAVTIGLGLLGGAQESSAEAAARHAGFAQTLSAALRESGGVIDANVRKQAAADEGTAKAIKSARDFGIASAQVVDGVLGQGKAMDELRAKLEKVVEAEKVMQHSTRTGLDTWTGAYTTKGDNARSLLEDLNALSQKTKEQVQAEKDYATATQTVGRSLLDSSGAGKQFGAAIKILSDAMATGDEKAKALVDALNALSGTDISLEQSTAKIHDGLAKLGDMFDKSVNKADGWGKSLITQDGHVNTATKNGRGLLDVMTGLRDSTAEAAQKTYDLAIAQGDSIPVALDKATKVVQTSRDGILKHAKALGLNKDEAKLLADQYDIYPELIATLIKQPGMPEAQRELTMLGALLKGIPPDKPIRVKSLSEEAQRMVEHFGGTVERLKDGDVLISANTRPALNAISNIPRSLQGTIHYYASVHAGALKSGNGIAGGRAAGGPVKAGQVYMVGEQGVELFRPDQDGTIIPNDATERVLGGRAPTQVLVPAPRTPSGTGAITVTINIHGATDARAVAEEVRRSLLQLRRELGGAGLGFDD